MEDKDIIKKVKAKHNTLLSYIATAINLGYNMMLVHLTGKNAFKRPNWFDCTTEDYDAELLRDQILEEFEAHPGLYGYGILLGKQLNDKYLVCIDIDIDNEYKEIALEDLKQVFDEFRIDYAIGKTKSGRYHVYVALDGLTPTLKNTRKLKWKHLKDSIKYKNGEAVQGEIELLGTTHKHMSTVYEGIIDDDEPFCIEYLNDNPAVTFERALFKFQDLQDYIENTENTENTEGFDVNKLVEFFKIGRKYNYLNGWDVERIASAVCVKNNMTNDEIHDVFQEIYDDEYDYRTTEYIIERTKLKDSEGIPGLGSVIHYAKELVKDNQLTTEEKSFIKSFIADLIKESRGNRELPDYLLDAEQVYFVASMDKGNKQYGTKYREKWYIERDINNVKQVWHIEIETAYPKNIYAPHRVVSYPKPVGIKTVIKRLLKEQTEVYEVIINDEFVFRPSFTFDRLEDIAIEISKQCSGYKTRFDITLFQEYLDIKLMEYLKKHNGKPQPCIISKTTGWDKSNKMFFHYDLNDDKHELSKDNPLYKHGKAESFNQEEQHELVYKLLQEGKLLGVLLTISTSSIFLKPFGLQPLTCILGGNPGAGKTTASLFATSLFYKSDDLLITADNTKVGVELTIAALNSIPILVDEGALANSGIDLKHLIFSVASGKGRTRGRKDLTVETKDLKSNVFYTSETTDIDDIKRAGTFRRMLYLVIESWEDFTNLFDKSYRPNRYYAGCGADYIRFAVENLDVIEERLAIETESFGVKYSDIAGMAETLYAGIIFLEEFYSMRTKQRIVFDALRETVNAILEEAKRTFITAKTDIVFAFEQYLFNNLNRFGQVDFDKYRDIEEGVKKPVLVYQPTNKEILGEYDRTTQTFLITKRGFEIIAKELEKEKTLLHNALYQAGVISKDMESKYLRLFGRTHRVYTVNFKEDKQMSIKSASNDG
jgi:hypothetical protein